VRRLNGAICEKRGVKNDGFEHVQAKNKAFVNLGKDLT
jgi:hypothetical protein